MKRKKIMTLWILPGVLLLLTCVPLIVCAASVQMMGDVSVSGTLSAGLFSGSFSGSGALLTNIPGTALTNTSVTVNQLANDAVTPTKIAFLGKVAIVSTSGGDYNDPATAMSNYTSWCGTPSATNPCLLKIMPGVYGVTSSIQMQPYIDIEGSGMGVTIIQGNISSTTAGLITATGAPSVGYPAELRSLTVQNSGSSGATGTRYGIYNVGGTIRIKDVSVEVYYGDNVYGIYSLNGVPQMSNIKVNVSFGAANNYGVWIDWDTLILTSFIPTLSNAVITVPSTGNTNYGIYIGTFAFMTDIYVSAGSATINYGIYNHAGPIMMNVRAVGYNGTSTDYGIYNDNLSAPVIMNVIAEASQGTGSCYQYGIRNNNSSAKMISVTATASGTLGENTHNRGIYNEGGPISSPTMTNVVATATSGAENVGIYNVGSGTYVMTNVTASASGGPTSENYGVLNIAGVSKINHSVIKGTTNTIYNQSPATTYVGATQLDGGAASNSGTLKCIDVYDESYNALNGTCQ